MKNIWLLTLVIGCSTGVSTRLMAEPEGPPPGDFGGEGGDEGPGGPMGHMFQRLGLSDDQKQQVDAIRKKYEPALKDAGKQLHAERDALGQLMTAHAPQAQAAAEHKKVQGLLNQLDDQRFAMFYEISGVLTADQRSQFSTIQKDMAERWHKKHHHGKPPTGAEQP